MISKYFIRVSFHPLYWFTAALILGISIKACLNWTSFVLVQVIITLGLFSYFFYRKKKNFITLYIYILLFFILGAWRYDTQLRSHENFYKTITCKSIDVIGIVTSIISIENPRFNYCLTIMTKKIKSTDSSIWDYTQKNIQLYLYCKCPLIIDDETHIKNIPIKKPNNEEYSSYLIKENIAATSFVHSIEPELLYRPSYSFHRWLFIYKENLLKDLQKKLSKQTFALFSSVFLGNRNYNKQYMEKPKDYCKTWGISHYLARSGLHLVIFIFVWQLIFNILSFSYRFKQFFILFLISLYYILSWASISFIRAFFTFFLYKTCTIFDLTIHAFYILSLACCLILLYNPMQLFFLDFQLSFILTAALAWFGLVTCQK